MTKEQVIHELNQFSLEDRLEVLESTIHQLKDDLQSRNPIAFSLDMEERLKQGYLDLAQEHEELVEVYGANDEF